MAMQVTHVVMAAGVVDVLLAKGVGTRELGLFLSGCIFPDIRYMAKGVARNETHPFPAYASQKAIDREMDVVWKLLLSGRHFDAGVHFHALCDAKREKLLDADNVLARLIGPWEQLQARAIYVERLLKMCEDDILHGDLSASNWHAAISWMREARRDEAFFSKIEAEYGVIRADVDTWYEGLESYLLYCDPLSVANFLWMLDSPLKNYAAIPYIPSFETPEVVDYTSKLSGYVSTQEWPKAKRVAADYVADFAWPVSGALLFCLGVWLVFRRVRVGK